MTVDACDACWEDLKKSVLELAEKHGVPNDAEVVDSALAKHSDFFHPQSYIQCRVARKAEASGNKHQLNFRAEIFSGSGDQRAEGALRSALESPDLPQSESGKMQAFMFSILEFFSTCAAGADFDPAHGLVKLWHFGAYSIEKLAQLEDAPASLLGLRPFCSKHGFSRVFAVGVDFQRCSVNLYFRLHEGGCKDADAVTTMLQDLRLELPADGMLVHYMTGPGTLSVTLGWNTVLCERACFYIVPPLSISTSSNSKWKHFGMTRPMPEYMKAFMDDCAMPTKFQSGIAHPWNSCFVSVSFGPQPGSMCLKQESDWQGCYHEFIQRVADAGHTELPTLKESICSHENTVSGDGGACTAATVSLEGVRKVVTEVMRCRAPLEDDTPLQEVGLDSAKGAFLRGQLATLAGVPLPAATVFDEPTIRGISSRLAEIQRLHRSAQKQLTSPEMHVPVAQQEQRREQRQGSGLSVRPVHADEWPALQALWREHHSLRASVRPTTDLLMSTSVQWLVVGLAGVLAALRPGTWSSGLAALLFYAFVVLAQHVVHFFSSCTLLARELRTGDLRAAAWSHKSTVCSGCGVVLVAVDEKKVPGDVVGAVCVRLTASKLLRIGQGAKCHGKAPLVAWLEHATVHPRFRGQHVASELLAAAETWARCCDARCLQMVCTAAAAKAACSSEGFALWNPRTGGLPLLPAFYHRELSGK